MIKRFLTILAMFAVLVIFGSQVMAKEITVRGHLQRTVEAGGWLIVNDSHKYLILNADRFKSDSWFAAESVVEAIGETKSDVMTIYMEGTPFEVRTMRPVEQNPAAVATRSLTRVTVSGDSVVQAQPDTAILTLSVVTQASRALDAQQQNATRSDAVVKALKASAGAGAEVKTSGYSLQPQRVYKENQPPSIIGYEARNTVTVVLGDLTKVGGVIDAAAQVGSNEISGISFTLRKDRPARDEALRLATREAMSKAQVIANALGGRIARIIEVQEEGTVRPLPIYEGQADRFKTMAASTPIEVGTLDITSRVQLVAEVEIG